MIINTNIIFLIDDGMLFQNIVKGKKYKVVFFVRSIGALDITISFRNAQGGRILASTNVR